MRARVVAQFITVATMAGTVVYGMGQAAGVAPATSGDASDGPKLLPSFRK
jgi:hypothetical protein